MANAVKTIGVLTSGGDAPGMNAATRAVVRTALAKALAVKRVTSNGGGCTPGVDKEIWGVILQECHIRKKECRL